ncbi:transcription factor bHLH52-like [Salvia splendens]|uniref:transcription factor bHLH52-like n=1 Tax=Salvia splendens TaxID=180675 RepID=UPI001C25354F|nr:transcription factor bHLH52-like [Salvia splendens]
MALSYYNSNWDSFAPAELGVDLFNPDDYLVDPIDAFCNSLLSDDLPFADDGIPFDFDHLNSNYFQYNNEPFPHFPKRQKLCDSHPFYQDYSIPEFVLPPPPPLPAFPAAGFSMGSCESVRVNKEESLSAQTVAARQRRRRITAKTQELGKLVPGGQKMNTAEMLQSAYKYIKFLQAQVGLLEFLKKVNEEEASSEGEEVFQKLLESPLIQEKLYSTEHCLIPQKLLEKHPIDICWKRDH